MPKDNISYLEALEKLEIKDDSLPITEDFDIKEDDIHTIRSKCVDLFLPLQSRLTYLYLLYTKIGDQINETISSIIGLYFFSRTTVLSDYLEAISIDKKIPIMYRIECAKNLENGRNYPLINNLFQDEMAELKKLNVPVFIQTLFYLMHSQEFKNQSQDYFCNMLCDSSLDPLYRYRTLQQLENEFKKDKEFFLFYAKKGCFVFTKKSDIPFTYRILACQYLYEKCDLSEDEEIESFLLNVASDKTLSEDVRADSCDIILQYTSDSTKQKARTILFELGGGELTRNNIFKNSQNVHIRSIEESVQRIIEKLSVYHPRNTNKVYDFETSKNEIMERAQILTKEDKESVIGAITRIIIDRSVYGSTNMSLATILSKVWTYIQDSEFKDELERRLLEELIESNNKCSSGYAGRIVNSLSGFDENMTVTISFEDQIVANLEAQLNKKIMDLEDTEMASLILEEMMLPVIDYHARRNFLNFFRNHISSIRETMYTEYCKYMEDIDYDMYFRKAIMHYEGVHSM